ncbi:hypothetical protein [Asanoa hainanensis]|uniref:hypothetical protein n=1 Tax=Asanoa hainanensis TaxID=560556 RepID=UPI000B77648D|nr:hypothetical protein [Asanoa hainanensis]
MAGGCTPFPTDLRKVDWVAVTGRDLNCPGRVVKATFSPQFHDVNADGRNEAFVAMRCDLSGAAYQIEVFDGASDPDNPVRIAVLARNAHVPRTEMIFLDGGCLAFVGGTTVVRGTGYSADNTGTVADRQIVVTTTWRNGKPEIGTPQPTRMLRATDCP